MSNFDFGSMDAAALSKLMTTLATGVSVSGRYSERGSATTGGQVSSLIARTSPADPRDVFLKIGCKEGNIPLDDAEQYAQELMEFVRLRRQVAESGGYFTIRNLGSSSERRSEAGIGLELVGNRARVLTLSGPATDWFPLEGYKVYLSKRRPATAT